MTQHLLSCNLERHFVLQNRKQGDGQVIQTGRMGPFFFFFLIYCKLGVVCTLHDEPVLVSTCCCALSLQCICDTGTDRRDSFTPALHCKHCNLVVFQASRHEDTNHEACSPLYYTQSFQTSGWRDHPY